MAVRHPGASNSGRLCAVPSINAAARRPPHTGPASLQLQIWSRSTQFPLSGGCHTPRVSARRSAMDVNLTLAGRDQGALALRLLGNNSLFLDNSSVVPEESLDVNTDVYSKVIVTIIYAVLFAVGALGNSITLYTLLTKKSLQNLQSTVHYHLASLAVSDLLILVLSMPIELYNFIWFHHPWVFGDAVCRGYYFLRDSCSYATALNIASLSVERYMAICHPFKAKSIMSRSRTKKLISAMWLASFALAAPMLFVMGQETRTGENICTFIVSLFTVKVVLQVGPAAAAAGCAHVPCAPQILFL